MDQIGPKWNECSPKWLCFNSNWLLNCLKLLLLITLSSNFSKNWKDFQLRKSRVPSPIIPCMQQMIYLPVPIPNCTQYMNHEYQWKGYLKKPRVDSIYKANSQGKETWHRESIPSPIIIHTPNMVDTKVSLKLFIDKKSNRLLFAEVASQGIHRFPLQHSHSSSWNFHPLLKQEMVGSLGNIYNSINSSSITDLKPKVQESLLRPEVYFASSTGFPLQLPNVQSSKYSKFYLV